MHRPVRSALLLAALALGACKPEPAEFARAQVMSSLVQGIGGPKAIARPGDIVLENDHLRVAILAGARPNGDARYSMGPGLYGGGLVDADLQRASPEFGSGRGLDQFAEMFTTVSLNIPAAVGEHTVTILEDGADGGRAVVRVVAPGVPFLSMLGALWAVVKSPPQWIVTDYIAEPGVPWLTLRSTVVFSDPKTTPLGDFEPAEPFDAYDTDFPLLDLAMETGAIVGDIYLSGGSLNVFAPGIGFDEDRAVFEANEQGRNLFADPLQMDFVAGVGDRVSYGIAPATGQAWIPLFTASQTAVIGAGKQGDGSNERFAEGAAYTYERYFFVGDGDVGSIVSQLVEARHMPFGTLDGHVIEAGTLSPISHAEVFVYRAGDDKPWSHFRTDASADDREADGSFGGRLPVGDYELLVHKEGRPDGERVPFTMAEGDAHTVMLPMPRPGVLSFDVVDETGRNVPAKISIFPVDGESTLDPTLGDPYVAGGPQAVLFPMYGAGSAELPPGEYYAIASRGLEYELDVSEPFVIDEQRAHHIAFQLLHSVQTDGWISADLHVHASPSHDSGVSLADRTRTMVCEGVEFFAGTDHDVITDYRPVIEDLGLSEWITSAVGTETTTIEVGHFLAFPLQADHAAEVGGAIDWTGLTPGEMIQSLRDQGREAGTDPLVFVGHPRAGILGYFDQYGFDPYAGIGGSQEFPGAPVVVRPTLAFTNPLLATSNMDWSFDALEVMGDKQLEILRTPTQPELDDYAADQQSVVMADILERTLQEQHDLDDGVFRLGYGHEGTIDDWFTLLNLGFRYTAMGNSDTHGWTRTEAGCPRNYIMSPTDDPGFIDSQDVADAVKAHQVVATYGPFVQLWVDGAPIGSDVVPQASEVTVAVEVQAPSWMGVDRVELYENGTLIHVWEVADSADPYRFYGELQRSAQRDAWYVAIASSRQELGPVFTAVEIPVIDLQMVVVEALAGVEAVQAFISPAVPIPRTYPMHPYALTNPIWVDVGGDGFSAAGLPDWLERPVDPADAE